MNAGIKKIKFNIYWGQKHVLYKGNELNNYDSYFFNNV